jgi:hypothetical protein
VDDVNDAFDRETRERRGYMILGIAVLAFVVVVTALVCAAVYITSQPHTG